MGAEGIQPSGHRAAPDLQETVAAAHRQRLGVAGRVGEAREVSARVCGGRSGVRPLGVTRRRGAADPRQVRGAVHADPGHKLIVADASQLEPRVLAALAQDSTMAEAARDQDLYAGIAAKGFGGDRSKAKMALLGAMYGATSGEAGRLMPQLAKTYPRAVGFVERAARDGEPAGPSRRVWDAAARRRRTGGSSASAPPRRRNSAARTPSRGPADVSRATSSSRVPRRTGPPAGWRNYDGGCAPCVPTVQEAGNWCSSCTTK